MICSTSFSAIKSSRGNLFDRRLPNYSPKHEEISPALPSVGLCSFCVSIQVQGIFIYNIRFSTLYVALSLDKPASRPPVPQAMDAWSTVRWYYEYEPLCW